MPEPYELLSNNPGISGPNDPEGPTCECGNVLPVGEECAPCADATCRKLGCEACQMRCEGCKNWFCAGHMVSEFWDAYCPECKELPF